MGRGPVYSCEFSLCSDFKREHKSPQQTCDHVRCNFTANQCQIVFHRSTYLVSLAIAVAQSRVEFFFAANLNVLTGELGLKDKLKLE